MNSPIDKKSRAKILGVPLEWKSLELMPHYEDLMEATLAYVLWDVCEEKSIGDTELTKEIMEYAKQCGKKALGME